jgi:hypothetical protein
MKSDNLAGQNEGSYSIAPSADGTYIIQTLRGVITRVTAIQYNLETHALARRLGIRRILIDAVECKNVESESGNYDFAYRDMTAEGFDRDARVALLVSPDDHSHDFVETVCRNARLNVTLFRDRALAEEYLRKHASRSEKSTPPGGTPAPVTSVPAAKSTPPPQVPPAEAGRP